MAKVYSAPTHIKEPDFSILHQEGLDAFNKASQAYVEKVQSYAKQNGCGPEAGEIVSFSVADGAAQYVVFSLKPVTLIHLRVGDAWQFPYAHLLNATEIRKEIKCSKAIEKMFAAR